MSHHNIQPNHFHNPILPDNPIQDPYRTLNDFFDDYSLPEIARNMKEELITCLTTDNTAFSHPEQRANLIRRHERVLEVFEALNLIVEEKRQTDRPLFN